MRQGHASVDPVSTLALAARLLLCALALWASAAQAHLMVAQKGTLNFKGDSAYLMVSLPVSAFSGFDDDGDGQLSTAELQRHAAQLQQQFGAGAQLMVDGQPSRFELLVLNLSPPDDRPQGPAPQLLVMGRYVQVDGPPGTGDPAFRFSMQLFGTGPAENRFELTFTRANRTQVFTFTPELRERAVFLSGAMLLAEQLHSGAEHVIGGADHLLFLMVVFAEALAARRGWRHGLLLISVFTAGHGLTLAGNAMGWFPLPPSIVEPAIAASIVVMALCTLQKLRLGVLMPATLHLGLVFACALVHGLGLGDALRIQGWRGDELLWALAGFNLGVELAQLAVAAACVLLLLAARRVVGPGASPALAHGVSIAGACLGVWWLFERLPGLG
jgi:HupE / UreJ protein